MAQVARDDAGEALAHLHQPARGRPELAEEARQHDHAMDLARVLGRHQGSNRRPVGLAHQQHLLARRCFQQRTQRHRLHADVGHAGRRLAEGEPRPIDHHHVPVGRQGGQHRGPVFGPGRRAGDHHDLPWRRRFARRLQGRKGPAQAAAGPDGDAAHDRVGVVFRGRRMLAAAQGGGFEACPGHAEHALWAPIPDRTALAPLVQHGRLDLICLRAERSRPVQSSTDWQVAATGQVRTTGRASCVASMPHLHQPRAARA